MYSLPELTLILGALLWGPLCFTLTPSSSTRLFSRPFVCVKQTEKELHHRSHRGEILCGSMSRSDSTACVGFFLLAQEWWYTGLLKVKMQEFFTLITGDYLLFQIINVSIDFFCLNHSLKNESI